MDDVSALRQWNEEAARSGAWLAAPRPSVRVHPSSFQGTPEPKDEPAGENPPDGATLDYWLASDSASPVILEILDSRGDLVRRYASNEPPSSPDLARIVTTPDWVTSERPIAATAGWHRAVWKLHYAAPRELAGIGRFANAAIWAPPGRYTVRLTAGGQTLTQPLDVVRDPRIPATDADLAAQFALARELESVRVEVARGLAQAAAVRRALASRGNTGAATADLQAFAKKVDEIAGPPGELRQEELWTEEGAESLRRLSTSLVRFALSVESADAAPTEDILAGFRLRQESARKTLAAWTALVGTDPGKGLLESAPPR
jgi:hypothetical protein